MSKRASHTARKSGVSGKRGFANRASRFVKSALAQHRLPGAPGLWIAGLAAVGIMTVTGGFATGTMPAGQRLCFWLVLIGWNCLKWQLWFVALVHSQRDWLKACLLGTVLLGLPLPYEIWLSTLAVGAEARMPHLIGTWWRSLAIGAVILATIFAFARVTGHRLFGSPPKPAPPELLDRAGIDPARLTSVIAEDHYCRVRQSGGPSALIHYRFGDALAELAQMEGEQVHRGAWVAANAVAGVRREGRRWILLLSDQNEVAVSATYLPKVRERGWLTQSARPRISGVAMPGTNA